MDRNLVSHGVTAFVDILGFSDKARNAENVEDIEEIERCIHKVQRHFEYSDIEKMTEDVHELYGRKTLAFSDCVIIHIPLDSEATSCSGSFDPIISVLLDFIYSQALCVFDSFFVRGGLDIGWWYHKGDVLISNGLANAAKREASANVPVIALCDDLYGYFKSHPDRGAYAECIDPVRRMFRHYKDDRTSFFYLDYIGVMVGELGPRFVADEEEYIKYADPEEKNAIYSRACQRAVDSWLSEHARIIEKAAASVGDVRVVSKYEWLSKYHNEVVREVSENSECICSLA